MPTLSVLYEDNHLLAVNKPAGLPTMGVAEDRESLIAAAREYIKQKYAKPGKVYLGVVSRVDALVTGVVLFARTSKAAARLSEQFRTRAVEKVYWAIVEGAPAPPEGECVDWLRKNEHNRKVQVVGRNSPGAQEARLAYRTLGKTKAGCLLEIRLETGRKHQIRVQLAHRGHAILGDKKIRRSDPVPFRHRPARPQLRVNSSRAQNAAANHGAAAACLAGNRD